MKFALIQSIVLLIFCGCSKTKQDQVPTLSAEDTAEVRSKLEQFDKGVIPLSDVSGDPDFGKKLLLYYEAHANEMTLKMTLPVSRVLAIFRQFEPAIALASPYVRVYSNDWHAWKILGGANMMLKNFPAALNAYTNATRLGDDSSCGPLAGAALRVDRMDIVREMVPHLLELKIKPTEGVERLDIVMVLMVYSLRAEKPEIFVQALDGIKPEDIQSRKDLSGILEQGCQRFKTKEVEEICKRFREVSK